MTMDGPTVLRALDPMERYFWMLGQLEAMNIVGFAELDCQLDVDALTEAVRAVQLRHPLLQARVEVVDGEYVFTAAPDPIPVTVTTVEPTEWMAEMEAGFGLPLPPAPAPLARCIYLPFTDGTRSVLLMLVHHAMGDGRSVCCLVQQVLRHIADPTHEPLSVVEVSGPPTERFPEDIRGPRHRVEVLGAIRQERKGLPGATAFPFHRREVGTRSVRLDRFEVPAAEIPGLRDRARSMGTTLHGLLGAAGLESASDLLDQPADRLIILATTTDLRARMEPPLPEDGICVAVGLLPTPYVVSALPDPQLASRISEQTRREVARGESHLFYTIMRAASFAASPDGMAQFAGWVATTPQNVTISNVGVIDDTGDPSWLRALGVHLGTSSNQVAFLVLTTYRGHLTITSQTDREKLTPEVIERFFEGVKTRLMAHRPDAPAD